MVGCAGTRINETEIGKAWAKNSVNTVIFRKNAITSSGKYQFVSYYDNQGKLIIAKRKLGSEHWNISRTEYQGNVKDAHNAISLAIDGNKKLHVSWDHHNNPLNYALSETVLDTDLVLQKSMTGSDENKITYPQFYNLKNGNLLFLYRSGESGNGKLVSKLFDIRTQQWQDLHKNLIDGEGERNAYWQACVDNTGTIHLSWVWRESSDVATNHDICYARSKDGGLSWENSKGKKYKLPITQATAEYSWRVPQNSGLINQTSMTADKNGNPFIATYWTENNKTDYQIIYLEDGEWKHENTNFRKSSFQLEGVGTKGIPISRPDIAIAESSGGSSSIYLLFRDIERGNKVSLAFRNLEKKKPWQVVDLTDYDMGKWEPNYDLQLWKKEQKLHVFAQKVTQVDREGLAEVLPTVVRIIEVSNLPKQ